jgi:hypothetical protein
MTGPRLVQHGTTRHGGGGRSGQRDGKGKRTSGLGPREELGCGGSQATGRKKTGDGLGGL